MISASSSALSRSLIWYILLASLLSTFVPVVRLKAELFSSLDVGMLSGSFLPFRSFSLLLLFFFPPSSSSLFYFLFLGPLSLLLLLPRPRHQEYFLLLHGRILSGISHIHHVITVIFSALRHVALPFLLFDPFEARTCGREIHKEFVSRDNVSRKRSVIAITVSFSN